MLAHSSTGIPRVAMTMCDVLCILNKVPYALNLRTLLPGSKCHYMAEEERDFWGSQIPNYLELYRVKSTSLNRSFKQMVKQCRLWKIGIMHSLWFVPLSCWAAEFSLCSRFWVVLKTGITLREIKLMFIQAYLQPKLYSHLQECIAKSKGKAQ
jgi:hypothetical protein